MQIGLTRSSFRGRTDRYAQPNSAFSVIPEDINKTLASVVPEDVAASVLSDSFVDDSTSRVAGYERYWRYYAGRHFVNVDPNAAVKRPRNYCRLFVDKRALWAVGKRFTLKPAKGNEEVAEVLNAFWKYSKGSTLLRQVAKTALTTGDSFLYVTIRKKNAKGETLPKDQWKPVVHQINPAYVFPFWKESDPGRLSACLLQFPIWDKANATTSVFSAFITPNTIKFYKNGVESSSRPNPMGAVNVVHIPCPGGGDTQLGTSILEDIAPLQDAYNELNGSIERIINYSGDPITIIYGARYTNMERAANKVWSNLPGENKSKVENLELDGGALDKFRDQAQGTMEDMCRFARCPKQSLDSNDQHISNTSGLALQMQFQPLIEATIEMQESLANGIDEVNFLVAMLHRNVLGQDLADLADDPDNYLDLEPDFCSLMPKDEAGELDRALKKKEAGIWSTAETIRQVGNIKNTRQHAIELAADNTAKLAQEAEMAKAKDGQLINPVAAMMDSVFMHEDLIDIAGQVGTEYNSTAKSAEEETLAKVKEASKPS